MTTVSCGKSGRRHKLMHQVRNNNTRFRASGGWGQGRHGLPHIIFLAMVGSWHCSVATKVMICAAMPKKAFHEGQHLLSESHAHALDKAATAAKAVCPLTPL